MTMAATSGVDWFRAGCCCDNGDDVDDRCPAGGVVDTVNDLLLHEPLADAAARSGSCRGDGDGGVAVLGVASGGVAGRARADSTPV